MKYIRLPFARPNPAVQRGGMSAVAMATPENTVPFSFLLSSNIPAKPPNRAISTSYMVGFVLASSSVGLDRLKGVMRKYRNEATRLISIITSMFLRDDLSRPVSFIPSPSPIPKIGPRRGEISIAPMMTGIEFTFRPTDAMMMENTRIHTFGPLKYILFLMAFSAWNVSICSERLAIELI